MKKEDKKPYFIVGIIILLIVLTISYIYLNNLDKVFNWSKFIWYNLQTILVVVSLSILIYFLINKNNKDLETPKERVSSVRAVEIWLQKFAKYNKIPLKYDGWLNHKEPVLVNESDVIVRDIITYPDPSSNTSDLFMDFEVKVNAGLRIGMIKTTLHVDLGEKYIFDNWNENIHWNTGITTSKRDLKQYPLTNPTTQIERLMDKKLEMKYESDFTESEINKLIDPYLQISNKNKPVNFEYDKEDDITKIPDVKDYNKTDDDDDDGDDINTDKINYRKSVKKDD